MVNPLGLKCILTDSGLVHGVRMVDEWCETSREKYFLQSLRKERQVVQSTKAAEALSYDGPLLIFDVLFVAQEDLTDGFAISY